MALLCCYCWITILLLFVGSGYVADASFHEKNQNQQNTHHHHHHQEQQQKHLKQNLLQYLEEELQEQQQQGNYQRQYEKKTLSKQQKQTSTQEYTQMSDNYKIIQTLPHDSNAYTQGLVFDPDNSHILYESTGIYGDSEIRLYSDFPTMETTQSIPLEEDIFGEGCTIFYQQDHNPDQEDTEPIMTKRLIQITWKAQVGYVYQLEPSFELIEEFHYSTTNNEGWGITYNPKDHTLIVTDGTEYLHIWDADTLEEIDRIQVTQKHAASDADSRPVPYLNELEYDDSTQTILANIYQTNHIVRINPRTGFVKTMYDFSDLYVDRDPNADVLNGIAIRDQTDFWITGKYWPNMYQVELN